MEYKVVYLSLSAKNSTEYLNELAEIGWRVVCGIGNNGLVLEKDCLYPDKRTESDGQTET